jgi:hypothetical protein
MRTTIALEITPQGLLIPRNALGDWRDKELEAVWEKQGIVIRPKSAATDTRPQVRQILREARMLYEPNWETPPSVSPEERLRLSKKLAQSQPLSEVIIADREERV